MEKELCYLKGSPWSLKTVLTLHCFPQAVSAGVTLTPTQAADDCATKVAASARFVYDTQRDEEENKPLSLPVCFFKDDTKQQRVIGDSFDILRFLANNAEENDQSNEITAGFRSNLRQMKAWDEKANTVLRFCRGNFMKAGDNVAYYMAPTFVTYIPGLTNLVSALINYRLKQKYHKIDTSISQRICDI